MTAHLARQRLFAVAAIGAWLAWAGGPTALAQQTVTANRYVVVTGHPDATAAALIRSVDRAGDDFQDNTTVVVVTVEDVRSA